IATIKARHPQAIGRVLAGHGITAWGDTSAEVEERSLGIIRRAEEFIARRTAELAERGGHPFGAGRPGYEPLPEAARPDPAAALAPAGRGRGAADAPPAGHRTDAGRAPGLPARQRPRPPAR